MLDRLLVLKFNGGDKNAYQRIYLKYRSDLLKVATHLLGATAAAEDVVQDVFVQFARGCGHFELQGSLKGYLAICVANRARDILRATGRRAEQNQVLSERSAPLQPGPEHPAMEREMSERLAGALDQLPFEQREVIVLHLQQSLAFKEIAQHKGLSINTMMSRYRYGLDKLRSILDGEL
jgi:RNA polymerase sigma factor (sigma-70 family)